MLSFPYPPRAVFIFTKIPLTLSPLLKTTFDQYPKRTDSTNYASTTKHFEHRHLTAGHVVQMETLAALKHQLLTFPLKGKCLIFLLENVKVLRTCYWCYLNRRPSAVINFWLRGNSIGLSLLPNMKSNKEKPLWLNVLFCSLVARISRACNVFIICKLMRNVSTTFSVIFRLVSMCPSV